MKKLLFVDNSPLKRANEDINTIKTSLELCTNVPEMYFNEMRVMADFNKQTPEEQMNILFDPALAIFTYSMYTANYENSLFQLVRFLQIAGEREVKGLVYFDASGKLKQKLAPELDYGMARRKQHREPILAALRNNYVLTLDRNDDITPCKRVVPNETPSDEGNDYLWLEEFNDLMSILK